MMIINMNDLYKIQFKCKKIVHEKVQYKIRHVASFMKVVGGGGGNLIQIFLASIKKERKSLKYRYHENRNSGEGRGVNFSFSSISLLLFLFSLPFFIHVLIKEVCVGRRNNSI